MADEAVHTEPARRRALLAQATKLDEQIGKGNEYLLLLAPADIPAVSKLLAQWREPRNELHVTLNEATDTHLMAVDADAVMGQLDELDLHSRRKLKSPRQGGIPTRI